ncbi:unnamed protein product [Penicillium bialowiezense]
MDTPALKWSPISIEADCFSSKAELQEMHRAENQIKKVWIQRQGDSPYRIDLGWRGAADLFGTGGLNLTDEDAVKKFLLQEEYIGEHASFVHEIIQHATGPFRVWPLYYFPVEHLNWQTSPGVALVGDAAHVTTPFVGYGVNCAMRNARVLAGKFKGMGITHEAGGAYEREMFPYAQDDPEAGGV